MAIPTFVIREMIPLTPDAEPLAPDGAHELTSENFLHIAKGQTVVAGDGEYCTLGDPIVADEKAWRKRQKRRLRKEPEHQFKERTFNLKRRADPIYKERAIATTKQFREANPDYKRNYDAIDYHRPFVIIDSEGCRVKDAPPAIIGGETDAAYEKRKKAALKAGLPEPERKRGVEYPVHASFLWGAGYWQRTRPGTGIGQGCSPLHHSGTEGADGNYVWLERPDKTAIPTREILHWLTELPHNFPHVIFASFAFGYDAAQILAGLPFKLRKKICRNRHETEDG